MRVDTSTGFTDILFCTKHEPTLAALSILQSPSPFLLLLLTSSHLTVRKSPTQKHTSLALIYTSNPSHPLHSTSASLSPPLPILLLKPKKCTLPHPSYRQTPNPKNKTPHLPIRIPTRIPIHPYKKQYNTQTNPAPTSPDRFIERKREINRG